MKQYFLVIENRNGSLEVLFQSRHMIDIDNYTRNFVSREDLGTKLGNLHHREYDIGSLYIIYGNNIYDKVRINDIIYKCDKINYDDIEGRFLKYLLKSPSNISTCGIIHVNTDEMIAFKKNEVDRLSSHDLEKAIHAYFMHNGKVIYSKYREAYFLLKNRINNKLYGGNTNDKSLKKFMGTFSSNDEYIQSLLRTGNMDELAGIPLEILKREVNSSDEHNIVDGLGLNKKGRR